MDVLGIIGVASGGVAIPLSAAAMATSVVGISQSANGQQQQAAGGGGGQAEPDPAADPRLAKFNIVVFCDAESSKRDEVNRKAVVLRKNKLWLDAWDPRKRKFADGHQFSGFYIDYPAGAKPLGLVSTISRDPPKLNWIYADAETSELRYGNKTASVNHVPGPWDWTDDQAAVTLEGCEEFVALEEKPGVWALYYDLYEDRLREIRRGRRVLEVSMERRREPKKEKPKKE